MGELASVTSVGTSRTDFADDLYKVPSGNWKLHPSGLPGPELES